MKNSNIIKLEIRWCSVLLVVVLSLGCVNVWGQDHVKFTLLKVDSVPAIKAIENMQIVGNRFCITYEEPKRWGSQLLRTYVVDETSQSLKFEHEYFRNPATGNGIDYPVLFQGNLGNVFVMDRTYPLVYQIDLGKHVMQNTHKFVFSTKSKVPYGMALSVPFAYRKSDMEFCFVGRQPKGIQAVYRSVLDSASTRVEEIEPLVYIKKYPAWTANFGKQTFNRQLNVLAHGFYLYPAIQYVNLDTKQSYTVKIAEPNWKRLKPLAADVWDKNLMQIKDITSTNTYVYALWWNKSQQNMTILRKQRKAECKLVVLDWNGSNKRIYRIPRYLSNVVALVDGKLIGSDGKKFWLITLF